ncbi:hypothetical protein K0504_17225 [Neiella marina]|uniref:Lipoprotein n=1 Tax=Neiella holothuriorum TaxID=2870530 RepID=A0ABS7EKB2_9GAMM|nr:hypothetical protein [Neiella holothuriorum]MBW8192783.1 hypothetical protein [Neiella holothuriorum]
MARYMKYVAALAFTLLLTACGGHGYEGTYKLEAEGAMAGLLKMAQGMSGQEGDITIEIGSDYLISEGEKIEVDEITTRVSNGKKYLVIVDEGSSEDAFEIGDNGTLIQNVGFGSLVYTKL